MNYVDKLSFFGVEAMQNPCIKGEGVPTTSTKGAVGFFYMDTLTGVVYKCTAVDGNVHTWLVFGQSSGGLNDTARNLLITILRNGVYSTNQSENITALENALASGGSEPDIPDVPADPDEPHSHSYTAVVTTPATCETAGIRTYTCSCGHSYTEAIPAIGHNYVDGTCTNCGAADPDYEVPGNNGWVNGEAYEIEWTAGYKLSSSGENVEDSSFSVSNYLPCYEVNRFEGTGLTGNYKYWFYDADKNFIGMSDASMVYSGTGACARRGAYFVRVEAKTTNTATATVTPYQDELLTESTVYEIGKNYRLKWTDGYYLDSNGHEIVGTDHCVSDFAFCYGATGITPGITERHFYYFYDADKNYISSYTCGNNKETIQIPANASYFRSFWGSTGFDQFVKLS